MAITLISTKFYVPPARSNAVMRPRLTEKLFLGLQRPGSFVLLTGPAGSGKTTLLSEFVSQLGQPAAWLSVDEGDNDPAVFWTNLIAACQSILPHFGEPVQELLETGQNLAADTLAALFINGMTEQKQPLTLILDDYHSVQNPSIHESLLFLLEHLPPNLHLILSTRIDPPLPLARFRARNQLIDLRVQDLRFTPREAEEFLNHTMDLGLSSSDAAALEARTEGWAAGLQLAALSLQGRSDIPAFIKDFTGSHLYVAEYLMEEVLKQQPEDIQSFLLRTSLLDRLSANLCEAVSGCTGGQAILTALHRANAFIVSLDQEGHWFRYHHLFADLLRSRLSPDAISKLHLLASSWYEQNGFPQEAVRHALAARDFERAAGLVEREAQPLIFAGRLNLVRSWLEAFPVAALEAHPKLAFHQFWIDALQNTADLSERSLQEKEAMLAALPSSEGNDRLRGELMAVISRAVALSGRTAEGIRLAREALTYLPPDDLASRARANSALAGALDLEGRSDEAEPVHQLCFQQALDAGDYRLAASAMMVKGLIENQAGRLHAAVQTFQAIVDMGTRPGVPEGKTFLPAGQGYIGLGTVHLEWNHLETAEDYLTKGLDLCRRGGLDGIFFGQMQMARLRQAQGNLEGALEAIRQPEQGGQRVDDFLVAARHILIALARGNAEDAWRWAAPLAGIFAGAPAAYRPPRLFFEVIQALVARVYLAQGKTSKALQLLDQIEASTSPSQRLGRMVEVHLLRALAHQRQPEAVDHLRRSLELAEPEGFTLLFLEEGPALISLLQAVVTDSGTPGRIKDYAQMLLQSFEESVEQGTAKTASQPTELVEQLTPREMEVLELLVAGNSNQAIAEKLVISVRTVKKHTGNIYGKLGVSSRMQAAARARELGLLTNS